MCGSWCGAPSLPISRLAWARLVDTARFSFMFGWPYALRRTCRPRWPGSVRVGCLGAVGAMFALSLFLVNSAYMHLTVAYKTMLSAMLPEMSLASKLALYDARRTLTLRTSEPTDVPVSQD